MDRVSTFFSEFVRLPPVRGGLIKLSGIKERRDKIKEELLKLFSIEK